MSVFVRQWHSGRRPASGDGTAFTSLRASRTVDICLVDKSRGRGTNCRPPISSARPYVTGERPLRHSSGCLRYCFQLEIAVKWKRQGPKHRY
ncbi:hypothetical protein EVAR_89772_1 [Eumeta japonica]|uniref:Uncharacterized protein n=1 Tax=Eumeta variegata TaxID=151549 RepID=A0A4C1XB97_EUMVA|nr:hypothetical protein EVAR_89772_1 [Eumeta japonica]